MHKHNNSCLFISPPALLRRWVALSGLDKRMYQAAFDTSQTSFLRGHLGAKNRVMTNDPKSPHSQDTKKVSGGQGHNAEEVCGAEATGTKGQATVGGQVAEEVEADIQPAVHGDDPAQPGSRRVGEVQIGETQGRHDDHEAIGHWARVAPHLAWCVARQLEFDDVARDQLEAPQEEAPQS